MAHIHADYTSIADYAGHGAAAVDNALDNTYKLLSPL
jgi:hypothetical protein